MGVIKRRAPTRDAPTEAETRSGTASEFGTETGLGFRLKGSRFRGLKVIFILALR